MQIVQSRDQAAQVADAVTVTVLVEARTKISMKAQCCQPSGKVLACGNGGIARMSIAVGAVQANDSAHSAAIERRQACMGSDYRVGA